MSAKWRCAYVETSS